jgi:hypothetical protein
VGIGVNAFTQHRVAQVEIPGLALAIWVDLSGLKVCVSKSKLRKLARYQRGAMLKGLVPQVEFRVQERIREVLG